MMIRAPYRDRMVPEFPCREMPTRHCPAEYGDVCGVRPCARYESEDETPWLAEMPSPTGVYLWRP